MIKEINVKLESDAAEVGKLVVAIVKCAKEKGDFAALIPALIAAVDGISSVPASYELNKGIVIGSFLLEVSQVIDVLVQK